MRSASASASAARGAAALALVACGGPLAPATPGRGTTQLEAELAFVAPYASAFAAGHVDQAFVVTLVGHSPFVVETEPAIFESRWAVAAYGRRMDLELDCSVHDTWRSRGWRCGAHDWPAPARLDGRILAELVTAARSADAARARCAPRGGLVLRRYGFDVPRGEGALDAYYEVTTCEGSRTLTVRCPLRGAGACAATPVPR